ncbi:MAG: hypothetical protein IJW63_04235 [Lachnospiraceae bacterium]|nr:hypothetical protein [Lachnospiraceae bacterium]
MQMIFVLIYVVLWVVNWYANKLGYYQKFAVKSILAWLSVGFFGLSLLVAITSIQMSYEEIMDHDLNYRLERVESSLMRGDFDYAQTVLELYDCYEEEFDYAWEQVDMYELYNRYLIYVKAAEIETDEEMKARLKEKALEMKETLIHLCENSTQDKNVLYAEYYGALIWE